MTLTSDQAHRPLQILRKRHITLLEGTIRKLEFASKRHAVTLDLMADTWEESIKRTAMRNTAHLVERVNYIVVTIEWNAQVLW